MMRMMHRERYISSGFSSFTLLLLACLFFLTIIITTGSNFTTASSVSTRPRGIAAIPLTSQSEFFPLKERLQENSAQQQHQPVGVKCKTELGEDVDWFIAYKLPKIRTSSNAIVRAGLAYAYILPPSSTARQPSQTVTTEANIEARSNPHVSTTREHASGNKGLLFSGGQGNLNCSVTPGCENEDGDFEPAADLHMKVASSWTLSNRGIDSPGSMVGQTLEGLYVKDNPNVAFLTYNDQPPTGPTIFSGGHTKGIIVTSLASGGIWIQHSVPHFPLIDPNSYNYQYPGTGRINGQVFHCISFSTTKDVDDLAKILEITKPHVVNSSFPTDSFKNAFPQLISITNQSRQRHFDENQEKGQSNNQSILSNQSTKSDGDDANDEAEALVAAEVSQLPCINEIYEKACLNGTLIGDKTTFKSSNGEATPSASKNNWDLMEIRSAGGMLLKAFIKGPSFNEDIYSSWIAPTYKTKLDVQSWLNGPHPFTSNCSVAQDSVYNILNKRIAGESFSTHHDHSKWAMSTEQPLVCISDLNRMEHQLKRGGVTVCFTDVSVWTTFNSSIIDVQPCPRLPTASTTNTTTAFNNGVGEDISSSSSSTKPLASLPSLPSSIASVSPKSSSAFDVDNNENVTVTFVDGGIYPKGIQSVYSRKSRHQQHHSHRMFQRKVKSRTYSFTTT